MMDPSAGHLYQGGWKFKGLRDRLRVGPREPLTPPSEASRSAGRNQGWDVTGAQGSEWLETGGWGCPSPTLLTPGEGALQELKGSKFVRGNGKAFCTWCTMGLRNSPPQGISAAPSSAGLRQGSATPGEQEGSRAHQRGGEWKGHRMSQLQLRGLGELPHGQAVPQLATRGFPAPASEAADAGPCQRQETGLDGPMGSWLGIPTSQAILAHGPSSFPSPLHALLQTGSL